MELLANYQGEKKSIATLNRWLRASEDAGFIRRTRRIRRDKKLGMVFQSTLYVITKKGYCLLARGGMAVWNILKRLAEQRMRGAGSNAGTEKMDEFLAGVAPLKNYIARVMKSPAFQGRGERS